MSREPFTGFVEAWEFLAEWMSRDRPKEERWEWLNGPDAVVEYYGAQDGVHRWWCGIYQPYYSDERITAFGTTPNDAVIAVVNAVLENDDDFDRIIRETDEMVWEAAREIEEFEREDTP